MNEGFHYNHVSSKSKLEDVEAFQSLSQNYEPFMLQTSPINKVFNWTPDGRQKVPIKQGLSHCPSIPPSILPSFFFFFFSELFHQFFISFGMVLNVHDKIFQGKKFTPKIGKIDQKLNIKCIENLNMLKNLVINFYGFALFENLYYLLCSCTNPYLGKFLFPRYCPKCYQLIRLQDFLINYISKTNQ